MKIGAAFPSNYLKKEDVGDKRVLVTIDRVAVEEVGQGKDKETKPVLYFQGHSKGMVLNVGNAQAITEIAHSDETDDWSGVRIVLYVDKNVMFGSERVGGLRVMAPPKGSNGSRPAPPPPPPPQEIVEDFQASDEDVPF